jgi:hypothetical protein
MQNLGEKVAKTFALFKNQLTILNNRPLGENEPNLVTLQLTVPR